jgi:hypothetical protein
MTRVSLCLVEFRAMLAHGRRWLRRLRPHERWLRDETVSDGVLARIQSGKLRVHL